MCFRTVVVFIFCVLTGCQTVPTEPEATDEERLQAAQLLSYCVCEQTRKIDDKVSDARVVVAAILSGPCYQQADNVIVTYSRGANSRVKEMLQDGFFEYDSPQFNQLLAIVLQVRSRTNRKEIALCHLLK